MSRFRFFKKRKATPQRVVNENENAKGLHLHREFDRAESDEIKAFNGESYRRLPNGTIVGFSENEFGERNYHTAYQRDRKGNFAKESLNTARFNEELMMGMPFNAADPRRQVQRMENFNKVYKPPRQSRIPFRSRQGKVVYRRKFPPFVPMRKKTVKNFLKKEQEDQLHKLDQKRGLFRRRDYHPNFEIDERIETIRAAQGGGPFKKMKAFVANRTKPVASFDLETYDRFQTEAGRQHVGSSKDTSQELDDGKTYEEDFGSKRKRGLLSKVGIAAGLAKGTQATARMFKNITKSLNKTAGLSPDRVSAEADPTGVDPEQVVFENSIRNREVPEGEGQSIEELMVQEEVSQEYIDQAKTVVQTPKEKNQDPENGISQEVYSQTPDHETLDKDKVLDLREVFAAKGQGATNKEVLLDRYATTGANHIKEVQPTTPQASRDDFELSNAELLELYDDVSAEIQARAQAEAARDKAMRKMGPKQGGPDLA